MDRHQIAEEVLAAIGGGKNVMANDICMTRLRLVTEDPSLVDTDQLSAARGVLGFVRSGDNGIEVVFGPGKAEAVHDEIARMTGVDTSDVEQGPSFPGGARRARVGRRALPRGRARQPAKRDRAL